MEARIVEVKDDQGSGVGLVIVSKDDNDATVVSDPFITADTLDNLRPLISKLAQAFEYPVLTEDEYHEYVNSGSLPGGFAGPLGEEPADRSARLERENEMAENQPRSSSEGSVVPATPDSMVTAPGPDPVDSDVAAADAAAKQEAENESSAKQAEADADEGNKAAKDKKK